MFNKPKRIDLSPTELVEKMHREEIILVDVREPAEFAAERIHGALNFPLSTFDASAVPVDHRQVVFQCGTGKRSAMAVERCQAAGGPADAHLAGGIAAWRAAGLSTISVDPATGQVRDPGKA